MLELPHLLPKPRPTVPMVDPTRRSVNDSSAVSEQQLPSLCRVRRASNPGVRASNPGVSVGTTMCDIPR